jgi:solute carrier family 35, member E3
MQANVFQPKQVPVKSIIDLAAAYVAYIVLGNLSIQLNPVGFYQITKALIAPAILAVNSVRSGTWPSTEVAASVALLSAGIAIATVTDDQVMSNVLGMLIGLAYVLCTAMYNIWAGSKQKQLGAGARLGHRFSVQDGCRCEQRT